MRFLKQSVRNSQEKSEHQLAQMNKNESPLDVEHLAQDILDKLHKQGGDRVYVVIVGSPGSGKSTIAELLRQCLVKRLQHCKDGLLDESDCISTDTHLLDTLTKNIPLATNTDDTDAHRLKKFDLAAVDNFNTFKYYNDEQELIIESGGGVDNSIKVSFKQSPDNCNVNTEEDLVSIVPMDGFHLSREVLDKFENQEEMHKRRGAYFTFDSKNYVELIKLISGIKSSDRFKDLNVYYPGFDHALKDPQKDQHVTKVKTKVVILEGLYLLLNKPNWKDVLTCLPAQNTLIYKIDIEESVLEERVSKRHVASGICKTLEEGIERFRFNDMLNGRFIESNLVPNDSIVLIRND